MLIKVCGLRNPDNVRAVEALHPDMIGFIFCEKSPRDVGLTVIRSSSFGTMDESGHPVAAAGMPVRVGVSVNAMAQDIIAQVYHNRLGAVQLHGDESPVFVDNLRRSIVPDIRADLTIIKAIGVSDASDLRKGAPYEGHADLLLFDTKCDGRGGSGKKFDWTILNAYDGHLPFIVSGGIGPDDIDAVTAIKHPLFAGIDVNSAFETAPAMKDTGLLATFITAVRAKG